MLDKILAQLLGRSRKRQSAVPHPRNSAQTRGGATSSSTNGKPALKTVGQVARPSAIGEFTGYEPRRLDKYHAPISINAKGVAGLGLFSSGFSDRHVYSGQRGEVGFYKALCMADLIDEMSSYWSVAMPARGGAPRPDPHFSTDVDCVAVQGSNIYLIDLKYYTSGDVTWFSDGAGTLLCRDNRTGSAVGSPRKMSRNMAMALERFSALFPGHRVRAFVVLIPTHAGAARIHPGTEWPGGVPLVNLSEMLALLGQSAGHADASSDQILTGLLKDAN